MAKKIEDVLTGVRYCRDHPDPICAYCPYESNNKDCRVILRNDISYWASLGKIELTKDGTWGEVVKPPKPKTKRKVSNGRRFNDGERRKGRRYDGDDDDEQF